jgi:hypothetical protein
MINRRIKVFLPRLSQLLASIPLLWAILIFPAGSRGLAVSDDVAPTDSLRADSSSLKRIAGYRAELHEWEKSVRGFRRDHHFGLNLRRVQGAWDFERYGAIRDLQFSSYSSYLGLSYEFHLQLMGGFGYYLGSGTGITLTDRADFSGFRKPLMFSIPGVSAGLVWNGSPAYRVFCGGQLYLERLERIEVRQDGGPSNPEIGITARGATAQLGLDVFPKLSLAMRSELVWRSFQTVIPKNAANYGTNVMIKREEMGVSVGLIYHYI